MRKLLLILSIAGCFVACNEAEESIENKKDSLDSIANVKKDVIDSTAQSKIDRIDSLTEKKKDALDGDSSNKRDTANRIKK